MTGLLAALFIIVPIAEIYLIIEVGSVLGTLPTIGLIALTAIAGASLARHQGISAMQKVKRSMAQGRAVGTSMVEAALVLAAAVTMLTPGFITDITGLALLLPPIRARVARHIAKRLESRMHEGGSGFVVHGPGMGMPFAEPPPGGDDASEPYDPPPPGVIDV